MANRVVRIHINTEVHSVQYVLYGKASRTLGVVEDHGGPRRAMATGEMLANRFAVSTDRHVVANTARTAVRSDHTSPAAHNPADIRGGVIRLMGLDGLPYSDHQRDRKYDSET